MIEIVQREARAAQRLRIGSTGSNGIAQRVWRGDTTFQRDQQPGKEGIAAADRADEFNRLAAQLSNAPAHRRRPRPYSRV